MGESKMGRKIDKFLLLMWKNFLLQWRHPIQTLIEVLTPVLFTLILVIIRSLVHPDERPASFFLPFENRMPRIPSVRSTIMWSPTNPYLNKIMDETVNGINDVHNITAFKHKSFADSSELITELTSEYNSAALFAGVVFSDYYNGTVDLDPNISVIFRFPGELQESPFTGSEDWKTDYIFPVYFTPGVRTRMLNEGGPPSYHHEGFLMLQQQLSFSIINYFKETLNATTFNRSSVPILMQRLPYPKFTTDVLLSALDIFVGMVFLLSFVYMCINTVKMIATEKEKQLKEAMKIMGLPNWLHWTAWFCKSFILIFVSLILMVILLKAAWYPGTNYTIFTRSNPFALFVFFALFACSTITLSFAISSMFSKANTAATVAGIVWFLLYAPYMAFQYKYDSLTLYSKLICSLCSNSALAFGLKLIIKMESLEEGLQWNTIWNPIPDDNILFGHVLIMLLVDTIIYFFIAIYVEAVFPGEYGVAQPWYFLFTPSYWCGQSLHVMSDEDDKQVQSESHEREPTHLSPGIKIKHLRKVYSNKKVAVRDLSLNMYRDQITVLLGHNGAGKTTVMSMLTGMISPTSGTATVGGYDIRKDIEGVRNSLGICPQHNILFDELTVEEHLYFYSKLKGVAKFQLNAEIEKYLQLLELTPKAKIQSVKLSGGMKRKLSVGVALCGNSKVVMCDEPTAGMDPSARRALWDLLLSQKKDRTILLTTHFMDEADLLGDRIAIMAGGKLECSGSSFFLKKKYGAGYHLIMDKSPECNVENVTQLFKKYIPNIEVDCSIGSELTYVLNEEYSSIFERLLCELEERSTSLGIRNFGISLTTLEEVFMKVGADHGQEEANDAVELNQNYEHADDILQKRNTQDAQLNIGANIRENLLTSWALWRNQISAMFMKRSISIWRSWILLIIQVGIPVIFLIITFTIGYQLAEYVNLPMIRIRLNRYIDPVTVIMHNVSNDYSNNYMKMLDSSNNSYIYWENGSLSENMIKESEKNIMNYNTRYITGATFNGDNSIIAWFSNQPYHGSPLALQLVINAIFQTEVTPNHNITIYNHPLPFTLNTQFSELYASNTMGFQMAFNMGFGLAFVSAFYVMFYIKERASKFKHLQLVSGVEVLTFWIPSFVCDVATFTFTAACIIITLAIGQLDGFSSALELGRLSALIVCFIFGTLPMMYLTSYWYTEPSTGYTIMTLINVIIGTGAFMIVEFLNTKGLDLEHIANALHWVFLLFPQYSVSSGIRDMNVLYTTRQLCDAAMNTCMQIHIPSIPNITMSPSFCEFIICSQYKDCCTKPDYFSLVNPGIGKNFIYTTCVGIFLFIILFLNDAGIFEKIQNKLQRHYPYLQVNTDEDEDVFTEKSTIMHDVSIGNLKKYNLTMHNVSKNYKKLAAVNDISLGVNKYECFGLLGVNGAGKTTTFKMLTGDLKMSAGDAWVQGWSVKTDIKKVYQHIGYCPQFDALLDDLTCRETLVIFGLLRGVTKTDSEHLATQLADAFDFHRHIDKKVKELSGGNKRKLSTAVALVGDPLVLYLDEPTAGVDPATKRYLWNALCKVRDQGKTIILTSHSMEECEALCTRLAIMVNGSFRCLGSTQHLKSKFSDGYTLTIKIKQLEDDAMQQSSVEQVVNFVKQNFKSTSIREKHHELITFYIADRSRPWSQMFGIMELAKTSLSIEDYSLGQCTLEQVFLTFAKHQRED